MLNRRTLFLAAAGAAVAPGFGAPVEGAEEAAVPAAIDAGAAQALALTLGFAISDAEAPIYAGRLNAQLGGIANFLALDLPGNVPPVQFADRTAGHPPAAGEDPYNAWLWRCRIDGSGHGLLAGKTVAFKDHIAVAGMPVTYGARALRGLIADLDATIVARCLAAGGVVTGKTALDGIAGGKAYGGRAGDHPRPLNPHDTACITGGSSSGSGAAVAAGQVDIAFGGDQGGSVRNPAAYCGVIGLKPTFGLVSCFGTSFGMDPSIDYVGPLARHTADVAAALQAVAGVDGLDARQSRRVPETVDVLSRLSDGVKGLRIGLLREGFHDQVTPEVREAVLVAAHRLEALGAIISWVSVPEHKDAARSIMGIVIAGNRVMETAGWFGGLAPGPYPEKLGVGVKHYLDASRQDMPAATKLLRMTAAASHERFNGQLYARAQNVRQHFVDAYDAALDKVDLLLMPTVPTVAMRNVALPADPLAVLAMELDPATNPMKGLAERLRNVQPFNYTGHPGISVPCGKVGRLPVGMQLVGRHFAEATLLRTAYAYEHMVDWAAQLSLSADATG